MIFEKPTVKQRPTLVGLLNLARSMQDMWEASVDQLNLSLLTSLKWVTIRTKTHQQDKFVSEVMLTSRPISTTKLRPNKHWTRKDGCILAMLAHCYQTEL